VRVGVGRERHFARKCLSSSHLQMRGRECSLPGTASAPWLFPLQIQP